VFDLFGYEELTAEIIKGTWVHPSFWPKDEPDLRGKKVAVIGTGTTGLQLFQELSKVAGEFVLFQRTPNLALPMKQVNYTGTDQPVARENYPALFAGRRDSFAGFNFNFTPRSTFADTPEERQKVYQSLWDHGDFHYYLANYEDMLFDTAANKEAYDFWKAKVRARVNDPALHELLAPSTQPHSFGCKRVSLENGFYEVFNQPNVKLVDVKTTPHRRSHGDRHPHNRERIGTSTTSSALQDLTPSLAVYCRSISRGRADSRCLVSGRTGRRRTSVWRLPGSRICSSRMGLRRRRRCAMARLVRSIRGILLLGFWIICGRRG
jgi:cation diffusion facilitator CzcD-associated flavoprotein CzcO